MAKSSTTIPLSPWRPGVIKDLPESFNGEPCAWRKVNHKGSSMFEVVYKSEEGTPWRVTLKYDSEPHTFRRLMKPDGKSHETFTDKAARGWGKAHRHSIYVTHADQWREWQNRILAAKCACANDFAEFCD